MIPLPPPAIEAATATGFAPARNTSYRCHIEQERDEAGVVRRGVVPKRAIRQRGTPPFDGGSDVTGTERIYAEGPALVEQQRLSGDVVARGGQASGRRSSTILRRVDARSGMILTQQTVVHIDSVTAAAIATARISQHQQ